MINLQKPSVSRKQKFLLILLTLAIVLVVVIFALLALPNKQGVNLTNTIPLIPTINQKQKINLTTLDPVRIINPEQKLFFDWSNVTPPSIKSSNVYQIITPVINSSSTANIISKFGYTEKNKQAGTSDNDLQYTDGYSSLFISPKTNQISYYSGVTLPPHSSTISNDQAISTSKDIISSLLGESFTSTLDTNPEIKYYKHEDSDIEGEPEETSPDLANAIAVSFRQNIKGLPIISLSQRGEVVSVVIDTTSKLYSFVVNGGYQTITENRSVNLISFTELQANAPLNSVRVSQSKDISSERAYTDAKEVTVKVKSIDLGYFQLNDLSLQPVYIINGTMSAKNITAYPAIYIVPAVLN